MSQKNCDYAALRYQQWPKKIISYLTIPLTLCTPEISKAEKLDNFILFFFFLFLFYIDFEITPCGFRDLKLYNALLWLNLSQSQTIIWTFKNLKLDDALFGSGFAQFLYFYFRHYKKWYQHLFARPPHPEIPLSQILKSHICKTCNKAYLLHFKILHHPGYFYYRYLQNFLFFILRQA